MKIRAGRSPTFQDPGTRLRSVYRLGLASLTWTRPGLRIDLPVVILTSRSRPWPNGRDLDLGVMTLTFDLALAQLSDDFIAIKNIIPWPSSHMTSRSWSWPQGRDLDPRVVTLTLGSWPWPLIWPWHSKVMLLLQPKILFLGLHPIWPLPQGRDLDPGPWPWPWGYILWRARLTRLSYKGGPVLVPSFYF